MMEPEDFWTMSPRKQTLHLQADRPADINLAAQLIRDGGTVAFPTETVYGLGANALNLEAVRRIFTAKQRPSWDPLIVHICDLAMLKEVASIPSPLQLRAGHLMDAFWPGPLTLLLPRSSSISKEVTAGRDRVGVRMPAHPVALALIAEAGVPLAAPSANRFGHTSPTTAAHVLEDLDGRIDAVLDGGSTSVGVESAVLDPCVDPPTLYRPGAVTLNDIAAILGPVELFTPLPFSYASAQESLPSPGVNLRHYAPDARLTLVESVTELASAASALSATEKIGIMLPDGWKAGPAAHRFAWGPWNAPAVLAQRLFAGLRELDAQSVTTILCPLPQSSEGLYAALRDRLLKAARMR